MLKKSIIVLCAVLILALVIGCSADSIASFGKSLGKLSDATLVPRNPYYVNQATANVKAFIEESEKAFYWQDSVDIEQYDGLLKFKDGMKDHYLDTVQETVNLILSARDSSANDKALRDALNSKYKGLSYGKAEPHKILYDGLVREPTIGGLLVQLEDPALNLVMLLHFFGIDADKDQVDSIKQGVEKLHSTAMPMPLQACDYNLIIGLIIQSEQLKSIFDIIKAISTPDPGEKPKIDMSVLTKFQNDMKASAGDRDYQTVGDKVFVGIVYSVMDELLFLNDLFVNNPEYKDPEDHPNYKLFFDFVFETEAAKASMDKILTYFDALSYVYNAKLDIAGLVSGVF